MSFYATQSYPELDADNPSLVVAWCHLLQNFGRDVTPEALAAELSDFTDEPDWHTITAHDSEITTSTVSSGWPESKNSVVKFRIPGPDGVPRDHYCLIFDPASRTILDSADGCVKSAGVYGNPASYASYVLTPVVVAAPEETAPPTVEAHPERVYTVLKGELLYNISRKTGVPEKELIEHNNIQDPYNLPTGLQLHLPVAPEIAKPQIVYELLGDQVMHISRPGGAQKWYFGNVSDIKDIISGSGMYPENKEVTITAIAKVPVGDETFGYYMDALALGDYEQTGKVKYTIGFSWADLTAGPAPEKSVEETLPPNITEQIQSTIASIEPIEEAVPEPAQPDEVLENPHAWKATYLPFKQPTTYIVDLPDDQEEILVHDLDQKRSSKRLRDNGHYVMAGTFWKDGVEYCRPLQSVTGDRAFFNWYGIPTSVLKSEVELYDEPADLPTKLALHSSDLTPVEKYIVPRLALTALSYDRIKLYGKKLSQKTREKIT